MNAAMGFPLPNILTDAPVRVLFGPGALERLGVLAAAEGARRALLVSDPGIAAAGYVDHAAAVLADAGLHVAIFTGVRENPTTREVSAGLAFARAENVDFFVGLGGGSAMDCAKGINLLYTNGGEMADYRGAGQAKAPLCPSILVPTTAGTGSEAQSFALISDARTHQKMACGDRRLPRDGGLRPRVAILDPELTYTQPRPVAAASGMDAIVHAVETAGSTRRTPRSLELSHAAWALLHRAFPRVMVDSADEPARADMLLGAHLAGAAIEESMLGAAHACANPLTAHFGTIHGVAVGLMLPHVVRFNSATFNPYAAILPDPPALADLLDQLLAVAGLPRRLRDLHVPAEALAALAAEAAAQWTATFNPVPVGPDELLGIYQAAY